MTELKPRAATSILVCNLVYTVEPLSNRLLGPSLFVPCIEVVLFKRFLLHYIDRGNKIWGFHFVHSGEVFNSVPFSEGPLVEIPLYK